MTTEHAVQYLEGLLGRSLRVHTTDSRMFVGIFKCTDAVSKLPPRCPALHIVWLAYPDPSLPYKSILTRVHQERNLILANSLEYRSPTPSAVEAAAKEHEAWDNAPQASQATVKVNMTSRLIGLIVIPGRYITKIELE